MTLGERVTELLREAERPMTSSEIAAELHVRHADVVAVLRDDFRFFRWLPPHGSPRKRAYGVAADAREATEQTGTVPA